MRIKTSSKPLPRCIELYTEDNQEPDRYYDGYIFIALKEETIREIVVISSCSLPDKYRMSMHLVALANELFSALGSYSPGEMAAGFLAEHCKDCEDRDTCLTCRHLGMV